MINDARKEPHQPIALITKAEAARRLGVSLRFLEILLRRRQVPLVRLGRRCVRIDPAELVRVVSESRADA